MYTPLIQEYAQGGMLLRRSISGLSEEEIKSAPIEGQWSFQQLVIHVADAEQAFAFRVKKILAEEKPTLEAWNENLFAARLAYFHQSVEDAVTSVEVTRRQLVRILQQTPAESFERTGIHAERGVLTAHQIVQLATDHLLHHLKFVHDKRRVMSNELKDDFNPRTDD
ncbi:MAG TPA: DinB family protein [Tepidisphaeraceae bacterium]|jgi:uncharacterized damage-inducible protein DinB